MNGWPDLVQYILGERMKAFESPPSQGKAAKLLEHIQFLPKKDNKK